MTGISMLQSLFKYPRAALVLLAFTTVSGCATSSEIETGTTTLEKLMAAHRESLYNCSPKALANAEVAISLARFESSHGRPVAARTAMEKAKAAVRDAWKGSEDRKCLPDHDADGIPDVEDKCPLLPEDIDQFQDEDGCPDPDNDNDGVKDVDDQCPLEAGTPANRGCPIKDQDGDGVFDNEDACPIVPGPRSNRGCPVQDADKDGVLDSEDKCPNEAGPAENEGCPYKLISITNDQIQLKQKVFFQTAKSVILKESFEMLDEVAMAIVQHSRFKVRIEGHTDSKGNDKANMKLSQARADSVRKYLVSKGVESLVLTSVGRGEDVPLDDNSTEAGRAVNRRVEFLIIEQ